MKVNDFRRGIFFAVMAAFIFAFMVASAGAINYGCTYGAHIYTVAGAMNAVFGISSTIIAYKKNINKQ